MKPFTGKKVSAKEAYHRKSRRLLKLKSMKARSTVNSHSLIMKNNLRCASLNVDGLNEVSYENVLSVMKNNDPDILFLLETKRRYEETNIKIVTPGYTLVEAMRSNNAGDIGGGGISVFTKLKDGIIFEHHKPDVVNQEHAFVNNERVWIKVKSQTSRTAVCGIYVGCQHSDDRY